MDVFSHPCTSSIPLISCISYGHSVLKPGVISCMLKTGVSKPVNFRPLLVGLFIFFLNVTKWHEFIFHGATLCTQAVSSV